MLSVSRMLAVAGQHATDGELALARPERFGGPGRAPVVVWNLLKQCNQSCRHCYASATRAAAPRLGRAEAFGVLERLSEAGVRLLVLSGGEPLLHPHVLEIVAEARRLGMLPHLSSNGTLLTTANTAALAEAGLVYVGVSIDGPEDFNDLFRGMQGGYRLATSGLRRARAAGLRTGLRMTVTAENADQVATMADLAADLDCCRFYVSHLVQSGRARESAGWALSAARSRELLVALFELAEARLGSPLQVVTGGNDSAGPLMLMWLQKLYGPPAAEAVRRLLALRGGNSAGRSMVCVDELGRVHPDQFWTQETLGNLTQQPLDEIMVSPMARELSRRAPRLQGRCARCDFVKLCGGSHRGRALALTGDRWASDPGCVLRPDEVISHRGAA